MQKNKNSIQYRLPIWHRMLTRPDGVSIDEMVEACAEFIGESEDQLGILRRDLTTIRSLLDDVEVLSPAWYREEIKQKIEENLKKYFIDEA